MTRFVCRHRRVPLEELKLLNVRKIQVHMFYKMFYIRLTLFGDAKSIFKFPKKRFFSYRSSTANSPGNNAPQDGLIVFDTNHGSARVSLTCVNAALGITGAEHRRFVDIVALVRRITHGIVDDWHLGEKV